MGATNHTSNYNLSQFVGTDKPAWLTDYNGDMLAIDTAIKAAANDASAAQTTATLADGVATSAASTASALNTQINTPSTGLAAVVSQNGSDITALQNQAGSTPLQTVAQTLTGAINEINTKTVKETVSATGGSETMSAFLNRIYGMLDRAKITPATCMKFVGTPTQYYKIASITPNTIQFSYVNTSSVESVIYNISLHATSSLKGYATITGSYTYTDESSQSASGIEVVIEY